MESRAQLENRFSNDLLMNCPREGDGGERGRQGETQEEAGGWRERGDTVGEGETEKERGREQGRKTGKEGERER